tara:strand:+ start:46 stop:426 length:381 start_codon:yes stop_codon:yes gene_type:complete
MANVNSATLTTMLSLVSKNLTNDTLNLKMNNLLVVLNDVVKKRIVLSTVASPIVPALDYTKSYVFVNNVSTYNITLVRSNNGDEYMHLAPGQWAWFPWSTSVDLMAEAQAGTPTLEVMIFELGHNQ